MYQTLSTSEAVDILRADQYASWSLAGAWALVEYLEQVEEEIGEETELCIDAIRCDYAEYTSAREAAADYGWDGTTDDDEDAAEQAALDWLRDRTVAIVFDGRDASGVIVGSF
jgi:hypothetical protein